MNNKIISKNILGIHRSIQLRNNMTAAEKIVRDALLRENYWFKSQSFFCNKSILFITDFRLCNDHYKIILEVDGKSHERQREYDRRRTEWLKKNRNCIVIRVTNEEVHRDINAVIEKISKLNPKRLSDRGVHGYKYVDREKVSSLLEDYKRVIVSVNAKSRELDEQFSLHVQNYN